jgi:decaprenylphospho-beta-D-erythro-pentofuranosid-2-ulose 2-reductase
MASVWKQAIVVGASSGMGEEIARQLAAEGCMVALVARRESDLRRIAEEISRMPNPPSPFPGGEGGNRGLGARFYVHDVTCGEEVPGLFQQICRDLGGLDLIVYAAGVQPRITPEEYSFEKDRRTIEVNLLGAVAWLNEAAQRFAKAGSGTIVGISSVAGDRGRRGYPVYGASKAALNAYLESLRNRVGRFGVAVVTIKAGPVDTPMTQGMGRLPMLITPQTAARQILAAACKRRHTAYIPWKWRPVMFILRSIPSFLFKKLNV